MQMQTVVESYARRWRDAGVQRKTARLGSSADIVQVRPGGERRPAGGHPLGERQDAEGDDNEKEDNRTTRQPRSRYASPASPAQTCQIEQQHAGDDGKMLMMTQQRYKAVQRGDQREIEGGSVRENER